MSQKYCSKHTARVKDSGVDAFYFDNAVIVHVFRHRQELFGKPYACFCCAVSENDVISFFREAADMEAKVTAGGGSYTTDKISILRGE